MDIALARTFLMVAETGSFIDAARKINITQSTVSARIKGLEELFGRPLFERSKNGASLTGAGEQFQKHALALVRVWQHAQLEVGLLRALPRPSGGRRARHALGRLPDALDLLAARQHPRHRHLGISASLSAVMIQRLLEGTLDLAIMYRPGQPPGLTIEHLFDEEFVLVTSAPARSRRIAEQLRVRRLGARFPGRACGGLSPSSPTRASIWIWGRWGSTILLANEASGYFPRRLVRRHVNRRRLRIPARARAFSYPVYMVYPEARDEEAYEPILQGLRRAAGG